MRRPVLSLAFLLLFIMPALAQLPSAPPEPNELPPAVPAEAKANTVSALDVESQEPAVVLLAVGDIINNLDVDLARREVLAVQRNIAKAALEATNAVVFVDEYKQLAQVRSFFEQDPAVKSAAQKGRILFAVVPHDSPWVRDYGPQLRPLRGAEFLLVDSRYEDTRRQLGVNRERKIINQERKLLCEDLLRELKAALQSTDKSRAQEKVADIKHRMLALQHYDEVLQNGMASQRINDDLSPYEMMQVTTGRAEIRVERPKLFLEGGNLLRLANGRLVSTSELFLRNRNEENTLTTQVKDLFGVSDLVYLDALPGPGVIRHADMFLLPAVNNRVLLASYDVKPGEFAPGLSAPAGDNLKELTALAAQAMQKNKQVLKQLGYEVVDIPALPPVIHKLYPKGEATYYPTLLNALTLRARDGSFVVLVPEYPSLDRPIQAAAHAQIRAAFGEQAKVIPIDCSRVAWQQGAVHCLTATVPWRISRFATGAANEFAELNGRRR